jgi:hypothetical protein
MNIHELREERSAAWQEMQNITLRAEEEGRRLTGDEIRRWEGFEKRLKSATDELRVLEATAAHKSGTPVDVSELSGEGDPLRDKRTSGGIPVLRSDQRLSSLPTSDGSPPTPSVNLDTIIRARSPATGAACHPRSGP